jgi:hypothetical protein
MNNKNIKYKLPRIICPICKKKVSGIKPKGGDGSALYPHYHISALDGYTNPCPGIFNLIEEFCE